jgi:hypothetical protein
MIWVLAVLFFPVILAAVAAALWLGIEAVGWSLGLCVLALAWAIALCVLACCVVASPFYFAYKAMHKAKAA